jgi:hypothetical protein
MSKRTNGIYCLEIGEWFGSLKERNTVEPVLELLWQSPLKVPYIHRDIATRGELIFYLRKWTQHRHSDYPILYLAFHGSAGKIWIAKENGRKIPCSIDDVFAELKGSCHKRLIHFGACAVLGIHGNRIKRSLRQSGAVAISGYARPIGWVESTVLDQLFLSELQSNAFTRTGIQAANRRTRDAARGLYDKLEFRMVAST